MSIVFLTYALKSSLSVLKCFTERTQRNEKCWLRAQAQDAVSTRPRPFAGRRGAFNPRPTRSLFGFGRSLSAEHHVVDMGAGGRARQQSFPSGLSPAQPLANESVGTRKGALGAAFSWIWPWRALLCRRDLALQPTNNRLFMAPWQSVFFTAAHASADNSDPLQPIRCAPSLAELLPGANVPTLAAAFKATGIQSSTPLLRLFPRSRNPRRHRVKTSDATEGTLAEQVRRTDELADELQKNSHVVITLVAQKAPGLSRV